jgi:apolipoprotein N-acyltransferase
VPRDAIIGRDNGVLQLAGDRVGLLISYETYFPVRGREEVQAGARALLVPTNTASYASRQEPAQELAATRLEAVATGRFALQAATTGYSALVSPSGAVLQSTALDRATTLVATLPLRSGFTLYDRFGELPSLIVCAAAIVLGLRRAREDEEAVRGPLPRRPE